MTTLNLTGIQNLGRLLDRLPAGTAARELGQRIGVWNADSHAGAQSKVRTFPGSFSELSDDDLSDTWAAWNAEAIRLHQLYGLLEGQRRLLEMESKRARAQARSRVRTKFEEEAKTAKAEGTTVKKPTTGEVNDLAEDEDTVIEADNNLVMLEMIMSQVSTYREACMTAINGLSREISFRQAQFTARVRA